MTTQILIPGNLPLSIPRGAQWAAAIAAATIDLFHRAPKPPINAATRESAKVRIWANRLADSDPRVAADLFAAADRHERMAGID